MRRLILCAALSATLVVPMTAAGADCRAPAGVDLTGGQAASVMQCLTPDLRDVLDLANQRGLTDMPEWTRYARQPYRSADHGGRYVMHHGNDKATGYGAFGAAPPMPAGARLALTGFSVDTSGRARLGPVFVMEKMEAGTALGTRGWRYQMILPDGTSVATGAGLDAGALGFCMGCHQGGGGGDPLRYPPRGAR